MNSLDIVSATSAQLNAAGAAFYFHPDTLAHGASIGLDGFRFYVLGRGGVLGDVEPEVVASAFGYFHPSVVAAMWTSAAAIVPPRTGAREYLACAAALGRATLADVDHLDAFNDAAETVISNVDVSGLALFAGVAAEGPPEDAPARAYRNAVVLRELRGSIHLTAIVAAGLLPSVAHAIRRPGDVATFGWDPAPTVTEDDRRRLGDADDTTDRLLARWFDVLGESQADAFVAGSAAISSALAG